MGKDAVTAGQGKSCAPASGSPSSCPKVSNCMVRFTPPDDWNGDYGFDWLRLGAPTGKQNEDAYAGAIQGGNGFEDSFRSGTNASDLAYEDLKKQYDQIPSVVEFEPRKQKEYFVPYVALYPPSPDETSGTTNKTTNTAKLKITIKVEGDSLPDSITIEPDDKKLITISPITLKDKGALGQHKVSSDTLTVTCNAELTSDQRITVWSNFQGAKVKAGSLIIKSNSPDKRRQGNITLVKVKTHIDDSTKTGSIDQSKINIMSNALHQAFIHPIITVSPVILDLSGDRKFKKNGHYIARSDIKDGRGGTIKRLYGIKIGTDAEVKELFSYLRGAFKRSPHAILTTFIVFFFNDYIFTTTGDNLSGEGGMAFKKNEGTGALFDIKGTAIISEHNSEDFKKEYGDGTGYVFTLDATQVEVIAHEVGHAFGLDHSFVDSMGDTPSDGQKYIFTEYDTDNFMDYANKDHPMAKISYWKWQWEKMQMAADALPAVQTP